MAERGGNFGMVFEFESAAMREESIPRGLDAMDQVLYVGLRYLYGSKRRGIIDREVAANDKRLLAKEIDELRDAARFEDNLRRKTAAMWVHIEAAASAFGRERTLENADRFYAAVYGLPNNWRIKRELKL